jgi:NADH-quinone oxidoreductase subunit M
MLLSLLIFLPFLGGIFMYLLPFFSEKQDPHGHTARWFSLAVTLVVFIVSVMQLLSGFDGSSAAMQFSEKLDWIPSFGISYYLGVDGISLFLVLLTTFLMPIIVLASYSVHSSVRAYPAHFGEVSL